MPRIKKGAPPAPRKLGGKWFGLHAVYVKKSAAKASANGLRTSGWLARVVKWQKYWVVYKRRKRRAQAKRSRRRR